MVTTFLENPPHGEKLPVSFLEFIFAKGFKQGWEIGFNQGIEKSRKLVIEELMEKTISRVLKKLPDWSDAQIADLLDTEPDLVAKLRADLPANLHN